MSLSAEKFDADTVAVMNAIAVLLFAARELHTMNESFKGARIIHYGDALAHGDGLIRFCTKTGTELLDALFKKQIVRPKYLADALANGAADLPGAIDSAAEMARMEVAAFGESEANADVIRKNVLEPLVHLQASWPVLGSSRA